MSFCGQKTAVKREQDVSKLTVFLRICKELMEIFERFSINEKRRLCNGPKLKVGSLFVESQGSISDFLQNVSLSSLEEVMEAGCDPTKLES